MNIDMREDDQITNQLSSLDDSTIIPFTPSLSKRILRNLTVTMRMNWRRVKAGFFIFKSLFIRTLVKYANFLFIIHNLICLHLFISMEERQEKIFLVWFIGLMIYTILKVRSIVTEYQTEDNNFLQYYMDVFNNPNPTPSRAESSPPSPSPEDELTPMRARFGRIQAISQRIRIMNLVLNNIRAQLQADISSDQLNPILQVYLQNIQSLVPQSLSHGLAEDEIELIPLVSYTKEGMLTDNSCSICLMEYEDGDELKILPCQHLFHPSCIGRWLNSNNTCPICRSSLSTNPQNPPSEAANPIQFGIS